MKLITLSFLLIFCASCGNYLEIKEAPIRRIDQAGAEVDFKLMNDVVFSKNCVSCHQQYASYQGVIRELTQIENAINQNRMPKNASPLSVELKNLLNQWIQNGAPETTTGPRVPDGPVEIKPIYESINTLVLVPKCVACHNPNGQASFLNLSTREALFEQRNREFDGVKLINFDSPDESYLLQIVQDEFEPMPPLPPVSNIPQLDSNEVQALKDWISRGMP